MVESQAKEKHSLWLWSYGKWLLWVRTICAGQTVGPLSILWLPSNPLGADFHVPDSSPQWPFSCLWRHQRPGWWGRQEGDLCFVGHPGSVIFHCSRRPYLWWSIDPGRRSRLHDIYLFCTVRRSNDGPKICMDIDSRYLYLCAYLRLFLPNHSLVGQGVHDRGDARICSKSVPAWTYECLRWLDEIPGRHIHSSWEWGDFGCFPHQACRVHVTKNWTGSGGFP